MPCTARLLSKSAAAWRSSRVKRMSSSANSALRSFDPDAETLSGINARNQNWDALFSFFRVFPARHILGGVRGVMKAPWQPEKPDDAALFRA